MEKRLGRGLDLKYWKIIHSSLPLGCGFWGGFSCFYFPVFFTGWWGGFVWGFFALLLKFGHTASLAGSQITQFTQARRPGE